MAYTANKMPRILWRWDYTPYNTAAKKQAASSPTTLNMVLILRAVLAMSAIILHLTL